MLFFLMPLQARTIPSNDFILIHSSHIQVRKDHHHYVLVLTHNDIDTSYKISSDPFKLIHVFQPRQLVDRWYQAAHSQDSLTVGFPPLQAILIVRGEHQSFLLDKVHVSPLYTWFDLKKERLDIKKQRGRGMLLIRMGAGCPLGFC